MNNPTAPYIPAVQTHWSFSDEASQRARTAARRQQAVIERAKRTVQEVLGGVLYWKLTGTKPVVAPVRSCAHKRTLTVSDLL